MNDLTELHHAASGEGVELGRSGHSKSMKTRRHHLPQVRLPPHDAGYRRWA